MEDAVDTGAIIVARILDAVGIENLDLIAAVNINAAVALCLTGAVGHIGDSELDVDVSIGELIIGNDILVPYGRNSVLNFPIGGIARPTGLPSGKIGTVKKVYFFFIHLV